MANSKLTFFILPLLFFLIQTAAATAAANPTLSCSQTPHPDLCQSMVKDNAFSGLRDTAIRATLARVVLAQQLASETDTSALDGPAKAAWADCLRLSQHTIAHLNHSLLPMSSHDDSQTWLSAAIANQQACRNGFTELNSSFHFPSSPFFSHNISDAVSNLLAINKAASVVSPVSRNRKLLSASRRFPTWVSAADRKLLQSSTVKANLVVAKDGSGNYKTISEAVSAAANQMNGASRFVIYVKAGTYDENVEISSGMKKLMIVGDGMGSTVITGNKNIVDGSTTYSSATFSFTQKFFF